MIAGTALPGSAVGRATTGFLLGAVAAASAYAVLLAAALRRWGPGDGRRSAAPNPGRVDTPAKPVRPVDRLAVPGSAR